MKRHHKKAIKHGWETPLSLPEDASASVPASSFPLEASTEYLPQSIVGQHDEDNETLHFDPNTDFETTSPVALPKSLQVTTESLEVQPPDVTIIGELFSIQQLHPSTILAGMRVWCPEPNDFLLYTQSSSTSGCCPTERDFRRAGLFKDEHQQKGSGFLNLARHHMSRHSTSAQTDLNLAWLLWAMILSIQALEVQSNSLNYTTLLTSLLSALQAPSTIPPVTIPLTAAEAKKAYTRPTSGPRSEPSLLGEFNMMQAQDIGDGHAYFSLRDTIRFIHAIGNVLEPAFVVDMGRSQLYCSDFAHSRTQRGLELLRDSLLSFGFAGVPSHITDPTQLQIRRNRICSKLIVGIYFLTFWSDSFESLSSKQNRGSVWVLFVTIASPSSFPGSSNCTYNSGRNTFLVAVGPSGKGSSHDQVYRQLKVDMEVLQNHDKPFVSYSGYLRKECASVFSIYCWKQDTPERTESNGLASWKSHANVIYGRVSDCRSEQVSLPSCESCLTYRLNSTTSDLKKKHFCTSVPTCLDWNPTMNLTISYASLNKVVENLRQCVVIDKQKPECERTIDRKDLVDTMRVSGISPSLSDSIAKDLMANPDHLPNLPALWGYTKFCDVNDSIEVVMHLLFLGIVRSLAKDVVYDFLSGRKQWTSYVSRTAVILNDVSSLNIYWLRVQPIRSGTFGGWVSENYLAYGRLVKYLTAVTENVAAIDSPYIDPPLLANRMTTVQMQKWLYARDKRVIRRDGRQLALRDDYVYTLQTLGWTGPGSGPPIRRRHLSKSATLCQFQECVVSCHSMVSSVMSIRNLPTESQLLEVDRSVKLYLSFDHLYHMLGSNSSHIDSNLDIPRTQTIPVATGQAAGQAACNTYHDTTDDESTDDSEGSVSDASGEANSGLGVLLPSDRIGLIPALGKRNKINLLKISNTLARYGPYRFLSELGPQGEGAIQTIKPIIKKIGGIWRDKWAIHVAEGWSCRRYSKSAVGIVADALEASRPTCSDSQLVYLDIVAKVFSQHATHSDPISTVSGADNHANNNYILEDGMAADEGNAARAMDYILGGPITPKKNMLKIYKNRGDIEMLLEAGVKPISVAVLTSRHKVGCVLYGSVYKDDKKVLKVICLETTEFVMEKCGASFFRWAVSSKDRINDASFEEVAGVEDYGILLPLHAHHHGSVFTVYYLITYWWNELNANGSLGLHKVTCQPRSS